MQNLVVFVFDFIVLYYRIYNIIRIVAAHSSTLNIVVHFNVGHFVYFSSNEISINTKNRYDGIMYIIIYWLQMQRVVCVFQILYIFSPLPMLRKMLT